MRDVLIGLVEWKFDSTYVERKKMAKALIEEKVASEPSGWNHRQRHARNLDRDIRTCLGIVTDALVGGQ